MVGCQSGHVTERLLCPTCPGIVRARLRRERLRSESAADLRCLDDGRAAPAHEEVGVGRLLACRRGADQQPRRPGPVPREARRDHSLLRDEFSTPARRGTRRTATASARAGAPRPRSRTRCRRSRRSVGEAGSAEPRALHGVRPRAAARPPFHVKHPPFPPGGNHYRHVYTVREGCERRQPIETRPSSAARRSGTRRTTSCFTRRSSFPLLEAGGLEMRSSLTMHHGHRALLRPADTGVAGHATQTRAGDAGSGVSSQECGGDEVRSVLQIEQRGGCTRRMACAPAPLGDPREPTLVDADSPEGPARSSSTSATDPGRRAP